MRVLVTGAGGMLGLAVVPALSARGHAVSAYTRARLDVTDPGAVTRALASERPDAVVHCAAYTAVDQAEQEPDIAFQVNAGSVEITASACHEIGARFVYPSTDYVFNGRSQRPYRPDDEPDPLSVYGSSKRAGEVAALRFGDGGLVVRTSWLFGSGGPNFVDTIRRVAAERDRLDVVDDQVGRPTYAGDLAAVIADLLEAEVTGTLHATGVGNSVSWYQLARYVVDQCGYRTQVVPVPTAAFPRPAKRPSYSVLDCSETELALGRGMEGWEPAVQRFLQDE